MCKIIFCLGLLTFAFSNIYDFNINSIDGDVIHFRDFKGKKILIVNISLESPNALQLASLDQLQQKYRDSLVIVAIPSGSFRKEKLEGIEMRNKLRNGYKLSFRITEQMQVKGNGKSSLYLWLTQANGRMKKEVEGDFHKYLIDSKGELMGYFVPGVDPMSDIMHRAIEGKTN